MNFDLHIYQAVPRMPNAIKGGPPLSYAVIFEDWSCLLWWYDGSIQGKNFVCISKPKLDPLPHRCLD